MNNTHIQYSIVTFSSQFHIQPSFVYELHNRGLIELQKEADEFYILEDQLDKLEHLTRLHCDFDINAAGLEVVEDLLSKMEEMQEKMRFLESKVSLLRDIV